MKIRGYMLGAGIIEFGLFLINLKWEQYDMAMIILAFSAICFALSVDNE